MPAPLTPLVGSRVALTGTAACTSVALSSAPLGEKPSAFRSDVGSPVN
jgi:hypothetical protein